MDLMMLAERENSLLGREFLTWLWFASDSRDGRFTATDGTDFTLHMEKKISVQGGEGESLETATVSGPGAELTEARAGLLAGKKVDKALVVVEIDADAWQLQLSSKDFRRVRPEAAQGGRQARGGGGHGRHFFGAHVPHRPPPGASGRPV